MRASQVLLIVAGAASIVVAALLMARQSPEARLAGTWKVRKLQETARAHPGPLGQIAGGLANALTGVMALELKLDHTFDAQMVVPIQGKWSLSGSELTLRPEKVLGYAAGTPAGTLSAMVFIVNPKGTELRASPGGAEDEGLVLVKENNK